MNTELLATIGANVRRKREEAGLSQYQAASMSGVARSGLVLLENASATSLPSLGTLVKLADVLQCPVAELLREPDCLSCRDFPPAGFSCNECGKSGEVLT